MRTIRTFAAMPDRRRKRSAHGAYLELAALALHRQRLLQEYKAGQSRNSQIEEQVRDMEKQAERIRALADDPDATLVEAISERPVSGDRSALDRRTREGMCEEEVVTHGATIREREFSY